MKAYIAVVGKSGAGKETIFQLTRALLNIRSDRPWEVSIHHFSDPLNEILGLLYLERARPNQQKISTVLRQAFGEELIGNVIYNRALKDMSDIVFLDGVRRAPDVVMLRRLPNSHLLCVEADPKVRFERLKKRADRPGDAEKTWEEFLKEQSAESESLIDEIAKEADFKIDNSGDVEWLRHQIQNFLNFKLNI